MELKVLGRKRKMGSMERVFPFYLPLSSIILFFLSSNSTLHCFRERGEERVEVEGARLTAWGSLMSWHLNSPGKEVHDAVKGGMWRERERQPGGSAPLDVHMVLSWSAPPPLPPHHLWALATSSYGTFANKNGQGSRNQACSRPLTWKCGST